MARILDIAVFVVLGSLLLGCAPWNGKQAASYVTVEPETRRDAKKARQEYTVGRKMLDKHLDGTGCDFEMAEKHLRAALAADVRFGPAHHSLGILYFWQGKLYLAAWEFEYATRLMPDRYEPVNNLGLVYESAGKFAQAKTFYLVAREKSNHHPEVIANLARASFRDGETVDQMRPVLDDVLATDPRPEWRYWAAELLGINPPQIAALPPVSTTPSVLKTEPSGQPEAVPIQPIEELPLLPPPHPKEKPVATYFDEAVLLP